MLRCGAVRAERECECRGRGGRGARDAQADEAFVVWDGGGLVSTFGFSAGGRGLLTTSTLGEARTAPSGCVRQSTTKARVTLKLAVLCLFCRGG